MADQYVLEPALKGKVVLHTSCGDLDVELWSKECPKASRNFIQLCLEGYYDGTLFHRIVPGFIIQGGDPTGTGDGGESIYDAPFPDEYHTRLKFRYRGLVGVANRGPGTNSNGSQFFITLGRCEWLNKQNTLFGKITGHTIYNLAKIGELPTDSNERPWDPPCIRSTEVLLNPFEDIVPRQLFKPDAEKKPKVKKREALKTKKQTLLSFEDEDLEDDNDDPSLLTRKRRPSLTAHGGMKSAHDVLEDPLLLKESAYPSSATPAPRPPPSDASESDQEDDKKKAAAEAAAAKASDLKARVSRLIGAKSTKTSLVEDYEEAEEEEGPSEKAKERATEICGLRREILQLKTGSKGSARLVTGDEVMDADLMTAVDKRHQIHVNRKRNTTRQQRNKQCLGRLGDFKYSLRSELINATKATEDGQPPPPQKEPRKELQMESLFHLPDLDADLDVGDDWMVGGLKFAVDSSRAYAIDAAKDALAISDPMKGNHELARSQKIRKAEAGEEKEVKAPRPSTRPFERW